MAELIAFNDVCYRRGTSDILLDLTFSVQKGEALVITGRSGSGKSTLLDLAAGLTCASSGTVIWRGADITRMTREALITARSRIGFVFQKHALIHNYPIAQSVALPLRFHTALSEKQVRRKVDRQLALLGIGDVAHMLPDQLSVAQVKYAALARALITSPELLLLDEPLSGLDPYAAEKIVWMLRNRQREQRLALLIVCNSPHPFAALDCSVKLLDKNTLCDAAFRREHSMTHADQLDIIVT
ncbi:MAG: ATP-binding cassette domain-containing protein [Chitinivibrionales bacterium]|nr:ATP-binding cassette domain-containing protein [Chitinivibrionales bacterium]